MSLQNSASADWIATGGPIGWHLVDYLGAIVFGVLMMLERV